MRHRHRRAHQDDVKLLSSTTSAEEETDEEEHLQGPPASRLLDDGPVLLTLARQQPLRTSTEDSSMKRPAASGLRPSSSSPRRMSRRWQATNLLVALSALLLLSARRPAGVAVASALLASAGGGCGAAGRAAGRSRGTVGGSAAAARKLPRPAALGTFGGGGPRAAPSSKASTALRMLLDVPDGFFTVTFPVLGILLSLSRSFARVRMEENAWEQRLAEGRAKLLREDPTLTELDLRRMEAAVEWSAYGKPRMEREAQEKRERQREEEEEEGGGRRRRGRRRGGRAATADDVEEDAGTGSGQREGVMSMDEVAAFEATYGVEYDPYYDDPYREDELPPGKFRVDKRYGDRVYEDGEVFYRTREGLYYRQGAKPRSIQFW